MPRDPEIRARRGRNRVSKRTTGQCCAVHRKGRCVLRRNHRGVHVWREDAREDA